VSRGVLVGYRLRLRCSVVCRPPAACVRGLPFCRAGECSGLTPLIAVFAPTLAMPILGLRAADELWCPRFDNWIDTSQVSSIVSPRTRRMSGIVNDARVVPLLRVAKV